MRFLRSILLAVLFAPAAWAYVINTDDSGIYVLSWYPGTIPMQIKLPTSPTLSDGTNYATSVQAAMQAWNALLGTVQFTSTITNTPSPAPTGTYSNGNGINEIVMDSTFGGSAFDAQTLAITLYYFQGDSITEADIVFNTAFTWDSYRGSLRAAEDIRRVAIHELGHVLGLNHPDQAMPPQNVTAIMNSVEGDIDTMQPDDIAGAQLLYGAPGVVPGNDNFASAISITLSSSSIQLTGTNVAASKQTGEPVITSANAPGHSVWWKWTAPSSASATIDTLGSNFDTVLGVYTGSAVSSLTVVASNDDADPLIQGVNDNDPQRKRTSTVTFNATGGTTYYIAVDGWGSASDGDPFTFTGAITLNLAFAGSVSTTAPTITTQPASQTVTAGSPVTFTAAASGTPAPTYQWQKNNVNINGATNSSYTIASVVTSDAGSYTVVATNSVSSATSNPGTLTVNKANPTLTWGTPRPIDLGTALSATQLNATASVSGTFVYSPTAGTVPVAGAQTLSVTFTPTDSVNFNQVSTTQTVVVTTQATFLLHLFDLVLQRDPTTNELISAGATLAAGGTRADALGTLLNTATYQARQLETVIRLYFAAFNRMPDYPGLLSWSETLRTGASSLVGVGSAFASSAEFLSTYGSLNNTQFVQQLYRNVLGREADPAGLNIWVSMLNSGSVRGVVLTGFSESAEFQTDTAERVEIIRLHVLLFGRMPTDAELTSWLGFIHGDDQASIFLDSVEFLARFPGGGINDQFVQTAFRGILRRNADAGAIASFSPALTAGTMTRTQLVALLFNSAEAQNAAEPVTRLYLAALRRGPDAAGLDVWTTYVNAGNTLVALAEQIAGSPEFLARYGGLSNQDYVEALYLGVLGRTSDPDGLAYWTNQLDTSASTRAEILIGFAQSAESIQLFDVDVRTTLLSLALYNRLPTDAELVLWHTYFATLTQQLREEFLESTEFNNQ